MHHPGVPALSRRQIVRKTFAAAALAASFSLLSLPAQSADNGIYLGASVGQSSVEFDDNIGGQNLNFDASATGFKAIAGWRFIDWLAVEANYVDLGSGDDNGIETDANGVSLSAVGFVPVGPVDLFARVGAVNWNADFDAPNLGVSESDDGTDLTYGVGAQFRVWSLSIRGEYEVFDISDADTVDMFSIGVTWTFL
jgi:opacity protein-like surface antigen